MTSLCWLGGLLKQTSRQLCTRNISEQIGVCAGAGKRQLLLKNMLNTVWRFGVSPYLRDSREWALFANTPIIAKWLFMHFGDTSHRCAETQENKVNLKFQHQNYL